MNLFSFLLISNVFNIIFMLLLVLLLGGIPRIFSPFYVLLFLSSLLDLVAFFSSTKAIQIAPVSLISPIGSFNPVFTTLIATATLHEIPAPVKFLGILVIVTGSYLLNISDIKHGVFKPFQKLFADRGVQLFLLANFLWAITPTFQKQAIFQTKPSSPLFASFFGVVLITVYLLPLSIRFVKKDMHAVTTNIWWFVLLGLFAAFAQFAAFTAFSQAQIGYVTAVFKLSTLFTVVWGFLFFKEKNIKERLLGASVMIVGTVLLVI